MRYFSKFLLPAALLTLILCFFMPNMTSSLADMKTLDNLVVFNAQSVSFQTSTKLGLPERIALIANPNADSLRIKAGKEMDELTAHKKALTELRELTINHDFGFNPEDCNLEGSGAVFIIDSENPAINMIAWEFILYDKSGSTLIVSIDDETGTIIKMIFSRAARNNSIVPDGKNPVQVTAEASGALYDSAKKISDMLTEYYGFPVELADYKDSGDFSYYRADFTAGGRVVPMYGVVRATGFTVNEKP